MYLKFLVKIKRFSYQILDRSEMTDCYNVGIISYNY